MRTEVSKYEIDSYRVNGYIMIPAFLDDDELAAWRAKADAEVAKSPKGAHFSIRARGLVERDAEWASMLRDTRLARVAAALEGLDGVRYGGDAISYCDPNCPPTPWHCGLHEGDKVFDTRQAIGVQMQLDDNTVQNKAMVFLPGTHKTAPFGKRFETSPALDPGRSWEAIFDADPSWRDIDPLPALGPAGSALFWNLATVHASGSNMTRFTRRYVGISWIPADVRWNGTQASLPDDAVSQLMAGDVLDVPQFPLLLAAAPSGRSHL